MKKKNEFIDPSVIRKAELLKGQLALEKEANEPVQFSLIEFNVTGLCTRKCIFCPRADEKNFPNVNEHMSVELYEKVLKDLKKIDFKGTIILSAFCEPLLYKHLEEIISLSKQYCPKVRIEVVTNGDVLTKERMRSLIDAGTTLLSISMYDGPHQREYFQKMEKGAGVEEGRVAFRERWFSKEEFYGITLSNRGGSIYIDGVDGLEELKESLKSPCYYPFYQILVDYDGNVLLCAHDWSKRLILGDIKEQSILEIWNNDVLKDIRMRLADSNRNFAPCDRCSARGILMGEEHCKKWMDYYGKEK